MPLFYDSVSPDLMEWALKQHVFWTASAPMTGKHINVSPKGTYGCAFTFLGPNNAAYVDLTGSGCETIAHVNENGRITIMFSSFEKSPRIMRLFCRATALEYDQPGFREMLEKVGAEKLPAARSIILLDIFKVQTSCGFGVPMLATTAGDDDTVKPCFEDRPTMVNWGSGKEQRGELSEYHRANNAYSLDGIPGLKAARRANGETLQFIGNAKAWCRRVMGHPDAVLTGMVIGVAVGMLAKQPMVSRLISKGVAFACKIFS